MEIRDFRGNNLMVHVTDVKRTTLMEQVADDYEQLGKQEGSAKSVFQEATSQTSTGQQYMKTQTNPSGQ